MEGLFAGLGAGFLIGMLFATFRAWGVDPARE